MEQLEPQWTCFIKVDFSKTYMQKIQVSLKCDKNNGNYSWKPVYIYVSISPDFSYNKKPCGQKF
jgi:hypothetical protein